MANSNFVSSVLLKLISLFLACLILAFFIDFGYLIAQESKQSRNWTFPDTEFHSELGWVHMPRDIEDVDLGQKQILFLGDELAYGHGFVDREVFTQKMRLKLINSPYQIHNLGMQGYDLGQSYLHLKWQLQRFDKIDRIFLMVNSANDVTDGSRNYAYGKRKPLFVMEGGKLSLIDGVIFKYCLRNLISMTWLLRGISEMNPWLGNVLSWLAGDRRIDLTESKEMTKELLERYAQLAWEHKAKFSIVVLPSAGDYAEKSALYSWLEVYCKVSEHDCIDYLKVLGDSGVRAQRKFNPDQHLTVQDHSFLADFINKRYFQLLT